MKICTTCGAQYDNEVEICSNDGTPLFAQFSATVEPAPVDESPVLSNPSLDDDAPPSLVEGLSAAFEDASASISEALLPGNPFEAEPEPLLHEEAPPLAVEPIDPAPFTAEPLEEESEDVAAAAAAFVEATKAPQKTPIPSFFPEESDENLGVKALEAAQALHESNSSPNLRIRQLSQETQESLAIMDGGDPLNVELDALDPAETPNVGEDSLVSADFPSVDPFSIAPVEAPEPSEDPEPLSDAPAGASVLDILDQAVAEEDGPASISGDEPVSLDSMKARPPRNAPAPSPERRATPSTPSPVQDEKKSPLMAIVAVIIALVVLAGAGYFFLFAQN